jgi:tight adherence protein C
MNDILIDLPTKLADPALWQKPSMWMAVGCGIITVLIVVRMLMRKRQSSSAPQEPSRADDGGVFGPLTDALAAQLPESEKERREFGQMLKQAGYYSPTARASVYAFRFLLMVFPLVVAGILALAAPRDQMWKFLVGGAIVAMTLSIVPRMYVYFRRQRRLLEIHRGLADMLDMLSMCIGGGMSLPASLEHVAKNLKECPALAAELLIMKKQTEVHSLRYALADFANRLDTPEVRQVATLLARGDALGVSIGGSLMDQADHFRTARKQLATLQANRTPIFLTFPLLFCFAPAVLILLMSPAFLQVGDFFFPSDGSTSPLANNNALSTRRVVETLNRLDQQSGQLRPMEE